MFFRICGCIALVAIALHQSNAMDWYVVRPLASNEICVNSTLRMAGNVKCPVPTFPIVNSTSNFNGIDKLTVVTQTSDQASPCMMEVLRMSCIKETEVCSNDKKYVVSKVTKSTCMKHLACLPSESFPEGMKVKACETVPQDDATTVPGPHFEIVPGQKETGSDSDQLRQSAFTIAAILIYLTAFTLL